MVLLRKGGGMENRVKNREASMDRPKGLWNRKWLRRCLGLIILGASSVGVGCTSLSNLQESLRYNESWNDWVISQRNAAWSARAWHLRKHHFCREKYLDDFCAGFRAGYMDVASGSNGCTPAFPPQDYWGWKYQSAEGQGRVAAWFAGYPHGARAAEEDGVGHFSQIQMSSGIYNEYDQAGIVEAPTHLYPMPENLPPYANPLPPHAQAVPGGIPQGVQVPDGGSVIAPSIVEPAVGPQ